MHGLQCAIGVLIRALESCSPQLPSVSPRRSAAGAPSNSLEEECNCSNRFILDYLLLVYDVQEHFTASQDHHDASFIIAN
jgi:hypothetical protein